MVSTSMPRVPKKSTDDIPEGFVACNKNITLCLNNGGG
jgi:hypothetical protein